MIMQDELLDIIKEEIDGSRSYTLIRIVYTGPQAETKNERCMICLNKDLGKTLFLERLSKKMNIKVSDYYIRALDKRFLIEDQEDFYGALLLEHKDSDGDNEMEISLEKR